MLLSLYVIPTSFKSVLIDPVHYYIDASDVFRDGVVSRCSVTKSFNLHKQFEGFSIDDFSISQIIATGSDNLLRPTIFRNTDYNGVTESMIKTIKMFDENEKAV